MFSADRALCVLALLYGLYALVALWYSHGRESARAEARQRH
jgi:hypothetical protein